MVSTFSRYISADILIYREYAIPILGSAERKCRMPQKPGAKSLDMLGPVPLESPISGGLGGEVRHSSFLRSVIGYCNIGYCNLIGTILLGLLISGYLLTCIRFWKRKPS